MIEFADQQSCNLAMANAKLLRDDNQYKNVYINPDKTAAERIADSKLRSKRNELNAALPSTTINGLRYGIDSKTNKKYYWGIRSGRLVELEFKLN